MVSKIETDCKANFNISVVIQTVRNRLLCDF